MRVCQFRHFGNKMRPANSGRNDRKTAFLFYRLCCGCQTGIADIGTATPNPFNHQGHNAAKPQPKQKSVPDSRMMCVSKPTSARKKERL